ncbi:ABC transporter permease [Clavibacter phaseoli]|uniref:ABC transporter permease n=1 Tax=Clavibacter phaseoli TaxID=1734031 RepID=UPI000E6644EE|nr:ABC transporter permease [Clavibacter phaseoli]RIJ54837.1 ABC transporter permease [Clavibacter phaseoli]UKF30495.1 ABC transporter permease [Clavibacter phaseoli]UKF36413.1 ABC transporter permease [Clavibacter phaseoli]
MSAATDVRADAVGGAHGWRGLVAQPVAIAAVLAAYLVWLAVAPLTAVERTTLEPAALGRSTLEHLALTFSAAAIVLVIAIPLGILMTRGRLRRFSPAVLAVANFGTAAPAIGLVVLLAMLVPNGFVASFVALVVYAALPVLGNTILGIRGVDERLVEAGRGMGMSRASVLFRIELPLAVPVMLAGIRTALVLLVGTAALAAFVNGGGLGILITTGVNLYLYPVLVSGALLIALLALAIDWLGRVVEHVARPKGL